MVESSVNLLRHFDRLIERSPGRFSLRLFVVGATPRSARAIANVRAICEQRLQGKYDLEVIDVYQQPWFARHEQVVAAPTLVKRRPLPLCRLVGDLSNRQRVLAGLNLIDRR